MNRHQIRGATATLGLGLMVACGVLGVVEGTADAAWKRISSTICNPRYMLNGNNARLGISGDNGWLDGAITGGDVYCAYPEDGALPHNTNPATLYVDISSQSPVGYNYAAACVWYANGTGGACGAWSQASAVGWNSLTPDLSAWRSHPYDYAYVAVRVATNASLAGYYFGQ